MFQGLVNTFTSPNQDVLNFLQRSSVAFEKQDASRTYLLLNDDSDLLGYISLTTKEITLDTQNLSKTLLKRLKAKDGIIKTNLIGQIGKNFSIEVNPVNLEMLLAEAYGIIHQVQALIGGRVITLECENIPKLIELYERHGFKTIDVIGDTENNLVTMYLVVSAS